MALVSEIWYLKKQSDSEAPVILELWEMQSIAPWPTLALSGST